MDPWRMLFAMFMHHIQLIVMFWLIEASGLPSRKENPRLNYVYSVVALFLTNVFWWKPTVVLICACLCAASCMKDESKKSWRNLHGSILAAQFLGFFQSQFALACVYTHADMFMCGSYVMSVIPPPQ